MDVSDNSQENPGAADQRPGSGDHKSITSDSSAARQWSQHRWRSTKQGAGRGIRRIGERIEATERGTEVIERVGAAGAKAKEKTAEVGSAAADRSRQHLGLGHLTDELEQNLDAALLIISAQRERIQRLEHRMALLEQGT